MAKKFSLEAIFSAVDHLSAPLAKMRANMKGFGTGVAGTLKSVNGVFDKGLAGIGKFSNALGIAGVASVAGFGLELKNAITSGAEFESTLIRAGTAFETPIKKGTAGFKELSDAARLVGRTTEFSAQSAAEGLNSLATAGYTAKQSISALPKIINFASAANLELGIASDVASDTLGAFNLRSVDAAQNALNMGRAMDVMVRAAADSTTNVTELFEAIKMGGPLAATSGASIEEFTGLVGVLANAGLKGSEAGTAIRNSFLKLTDATPEAVETMKRLGIQIARSKDGAIDMTATIGRFAKGTAKLTKAQKAQAISAVFGAYTVGPFLSLMNAGEGTIKQFTANLEKATGVTQQMAETMREATSKKIANFWNVIADIKLGVFEAISGTVLEIAGSISKWVTANQALINTTAAEWAVTLRDSLPGLWKWIKRCTVALGVFVAVAYTIKTISAVVTVINALTTAFAFLEFGALLLGTTLGAVLWPITLIGLAIAGLVALAWAYWPEISAFFTAVKDWAVKAIGVMWDWIKGAFAKAKEFLTGVFEFIVGVLTVIFDPWVADAKRVWGAITAVFDSAVGVIKAIWEPIGQFFSDIWDKIVGMAGTFVESIKTMLQPLGDVFSSIWKGIADGFMAIVSPIFEKIKGFINYVRSIGRGTLGTDAPAPGEQNESIPEMVTPGARAASEAIESRNENSSSVDGTIVVEAKPGTKAQVKPGRGPIKIIPAHSGAFP